MALHPADSSAALKAHIKASEKLVLHAYFDPVGVTKYPDYIVSSIVAQNAALIQQMLDASPIDALTFAE